MSTERKLHAKLAQVMEEVGRIPKNGVAPAAMGGFQFVQAGDAADAIRKALASRQVSMIPSGVDVLGESEHPTANGKVMTTLTIRTTWTLTDGETGETAIIQSIGSGADMGDKAAPKAQTSAMKYALLMGFLLSTGDDPEQADTSDRQQRQRRAQTQQAATAAADARPVAASVAPAASGPVTAHGWTEGQQHDPEHRPLKAKNGHLFCPTKLPNGAWCSWRAEEAAASPVAAPVAVPDEPGPAAGNLCGAKSVYNDGTTCNLLRGHSGPSHRVLDDTGKPMSSWPVAA